MCAPDLLSEQVNPEALRLASVNWDFFCTLTLPNRLQPAPPDHRKRGNIESVGFVGIEAVAAKTVFAWLREAAVVLGVHFKRLLFMLRCERGEMGGRLHFHALLAGKLGCAEERNRWRLQAIWEKYSSAFADIRLFDPTLPGVDYLLKEDWYDGANRYEMDKFSLDSSRVMLSRSVVAAMLPRIAADVRDAR